jgi:hypothetical protein
MSSDCCSGALRSHWEMHSPLPLGVALGLVLGTVLRGYLAGGWAELLHWNISPSTVGDRLGEARAARRVLGVDRFLTGQYARCHLGTALGSGWVQHWERRTVLGAVLGPKLGTRLAGTWGPDRQALGTVLGEGAEFNTGESR